MWSNQYIIIFVSLLHDTFLHIYSWYAVKCQQCRQVMLFEKLLPPLRLYRANMC